jgi:chromosome segregation ATPase
MIESTRNQAFEKQLEFFEQQRLEYNSRIDKLQGDNLDKDRQLAQLQHKQERVQEDCDRKTRDLAQNIEHLTRERDQLSERQESLKKKLSDTQDDAQQQQLVFGRD